ncbi:hypothetical protein E5288_WYG017903 [Bos mutus]|uniref:Uncharacterized protein n=1 Tax=Bos mutus TaxID=72004 RepID=A0A6B0S4X2_9CETA|nr:hypothetical protein [Bos mutus]
MVMSARLTHPSRLQVYTPRLRSCLKNRGGFSLEIMPQILASDSVDSKLRRIPQHLVQSESSYRLDEKGGSQDTFQDDALVETQTKPPGGGNLNPSENPITDPFRG